MKRIKAMIVNKYRQHALEKTRKTLEAIAYTGNQWRAADRLWIDGGSAHHVSTARRAGFIEPKGIKGYVLIGRPHDMVKLTPLGLSAIKAYSSHTMTVQEARKLPEIGGA